MENKQNTSYENFVNEMETIYAKMPNIFSGKLASKCLKKKGFGYYVENLQMRNWLIDKGCETFGKMMYRKPQENATNSIIVEKEKADELRIAIATCEKHGFLVYRKDQEMLEKCVDYCKRHGLVVSKKEVKLIEL